MVTFAAAHRFFLGAVGCLHHRGAMARGSWLGWEPRFRVNGEPGLAEIDGHDRGVAAYAPGGVLYPDVLAWAEELGTPGDVLAPEGGRFSKRVRGGRDRQLSLDDAVEAIAVAGVSIEQSCPIAGELP